MTLKLNNNRVIIQYLELIFCFFVLVFCELFFFRNVIGNDKLIGDTGDGRLTMLITEHWFHFFQGKCNFSDLGMFYPASNTLAYSDMLLGYGIIHSFFRLFDVDIYISYKYTLLFIHVIGTFSAFFLLKKSLRVSFVWSLFGVIAFSFSSTYASAINHTQLVSISFLPLACIFLVNYFICFNNPLRRNVFALCFIFSMILILYTAWYIAFFSALFIFVFTICFCVLFRERISFKSIAKVFKVIKYDLVFYCIIVFLLLIPFVRLELSVLNMSGKRSFNSLNIYMPEIIDVFNVTSRNWLLGRLIDKSGLNNRGLAYDEVGYGFSFVHLIVFFISIILLNTKKRNKNMDIKLLTLYSLGIAVIVNVLLVVKLSSNGLSLWWFVYRLFPGASSLRAIGRYLFFLSFPMCVFSSCAADRLEMFSIKKLGKDKLKRIPVFCVLILLFFSNIRIEGVVSRWNKSDSESFVNSVSVPPKDCKVFFIVPESDSDSNETNIQLDAYQIANKYNIKTINGYSGVFPEGWWNAVWFAKDSKYISAVSGWVIKNEIDSVYSYDLNTNTWQIYDPYEYVTPCFSAQDNTIPVLSEGIYPLDPQSNYCWTENKCSLIIKDQEISRSGLFIKVSFPVDWYNEQNSGVDPYCYIYVNGNFAQELSVDNEMSEALIHVEPSKDDVYEIEIETNCYFIPNEVGINQDNRVLSMRLYYVGANQV